MRNQLLIGALLLSLAACKEDDKDNNNTPNNPTDTAKTIQNGADIPTTTIAAAPTTVLVTSLPAPDTNASAVNYPQVLAPRPANMTFQAPAGFVMNLYEEMIPNARNLAVAPNGDVFVAQGPMNQISVLRDLNGDGHADTTYLWAAGGMLQTPYGMAFFQNKFYVACSGVLLRYDYTRGQTAAAGSPTALAMYPGGGQHPSRSLALDSVAGKIYIGIGSTGNVNIEDDPHYATIQQFNLDGTGRMGVASGIRVPQGLALEPVSRKLYSVVNERDGLGDDLVPDYMAAISIGDHYGWPSVYLAPGNRDARVPAGPLDAQTKTPEVLFQAHSAALGIMFYTGSQFPADYRNDAYVALRGSWNRANGTGYKIARVKMNGSGLPEGQGYEDFITGWQTNRGQAGVPQAFGRPISIAVSKDGSMLIADDAGGAIWRLRYKG